MKKFLVLDAASLLLLPPAAHAGKSNEVVVGIDTGRGPAHVTIERVGAAAIEDGNPAWARNLAE